MMEASRVDTRDMRRLFIIKKKNFMRNHRLTTIILAAVFAFLFVGCGSSSEKAGKAGLFPFGDAAGKTGYVRLDGKIVVEPKFVYGHVFRDGLALVEEAQEDGKICLGYIKENGDFLLKPQYKDATQFNDGLAWVVEEGGCPKAIDTKGNVLFEAKDAKHVRCFSEGFAAAWLSGDLFTPRWGFLDKKGNVAIEPIYKEVAWFSDGIAAVKKENHWGFIDTKGNMVIPEQFYETKPFHNGLAVVKDPSFRWGVIDKTGKCVIPFEYSEMEADGDLFMVKKGDKAGWIDKDGNWVIDAPWHVALPFAGANLAAVKNEDCYWGFINKKGEVVIDFQYAYACPFTGGKAIVSEDGIWMRIIDEKGKPVAVKSSMLFSLNDHYYPQQEVLESAMANYPSVAYIAHNYCKNVR